MVVEMVNVFWLWWPKCITLHLESLNGSCHCLNQLSKLLRSSCISFSLDTLTAPYSMQSSVNSLHMLYFTSSGISLMKITKSIGPSTEPWGIPLITPFHSDVIPSTLTHWLLPLKNDLIQFSRSPFIPMFSNFSNSLSRATESNALTKYVHQKLTVFNHVCPIFHTY